MFTGLIAELGTITAIDKGESSAVFTIAAPALISQIALGDSVAVNGVCLTATAITGETFTADVMVQTLANKRYTYFASTSTSTLIKSPAFLPESIGLPLITQQRLQISCAWIT